tara:strand:+ start:786 stop:980 length:195 start_codon:yes stop_codon:yes gene_type:complete
MKKAKLTSVKILEDLYTNFKSKTVNTDMTLQKLTNRSIFLFLEDDKYQETINSTDNLIVSGSSL